MFILEIRHATKTRVHAGSSAKERQFGPDVSEDTHRSDSGTMLFEKYGP